MSTLTEMVLIGGANDGRRVQLDNRNRPVVLRQAIPRSKLDSGPEVGAVTFNNVREMADDTEAYSLILISICYENHEVYIHQGLPIDKLLPTLLSGYRRMAP